ncbi:ABC transporter ATP-binding protein [Rhodococcus erythropolis]|uniref:ABC transporter ATP-binding protein n=1 Tax=Rhodococcus erythropolis TaxID=1833 RepID=UPI002109AC4E|nr:ABC transporter ATP-binding protein [Rhodococcus erythropolis]MCQ4129069.1 ABC transporter ATP-binding protein [Rhodococcus erythropolis]
MTSLDETLPSTARSILKEPPVLKVQGLTTEFTRHGSTKRVVDDVSFEVGAGETLGIVGESGCGKSVTMLSLVDLLPKPGGQVVAGEVIFDGRDLRSLSARQMTAIRGAEIGYVFQDPMSSLNPTLTVGAQLAEPLRAHLGLSRNAAKARAIDLLARVGISDPRRRFDGYPHEFSGGMRQRVMIAIAVACEPKLLIADEPTTALDVTVQAQVLDLLGSMTSELGMSLLLITHDLGVAARVCDRVNVMYAGQIVESSPVDELFLRPQMPYLKGLLACLPRLDGDLSEPLIPIPGSLPDLGVALDGCRFAERCTFARDVCRGRAPALSPRGAHHLARCHATEKGGWL